MTSSHLVKAGDHVDRLAFKNGLLPDVIWDHPDNSELKERRVKGEILEPGDRIAIPEIRPKEESGATDACHRFRRKGVPARLELRLTVEGEPWADTAYDLDIDGNSESGETDGDGKISHAIPPDARQGRLIIGEGDDRCVYALSLGHLDPISGVKGVQHRLNNLGYRVGEPDGVLSDKTRAAVARFQCAVGLEETGEIDDTTRARLEETHGS